MTVSPFDSPMFGRLLSDPNTAAVFSDSVYMRAILAVEGALAVAQATEGMIPLDAAKRIAEACGVLEVGSSVLSETTLASGSPVSGLVTMVRAALDGEAGGFVHKGASDQDIIDTALVLRLRGVLDAFDGRLSAVCDTLAEVADTHKGTLMAGRVHGRVSEPTTFGRKVLTWREPLMRHRDRLAELRPRLMVVSLAGDGGAHSAMGDEYDGVVASMAAALGLAVPAQPWHAQRDTIAELATWLSLVTGSLGKIGRDLVLLGQNEVAEVRIGECLSAPEKAAPIAAEAMVALAAFNAGLLSVLHGGQVHAQERDGAAWMSEWLALPQMVVATGTSLNHALEILDDLVVDSARMQANLGDGIA